MSKLIAVLIAMMAMLAVPAVASADTVVTNDANVFQPISTAPPSYDYIDKAHGQDKFRICHRTGSASNPFVVITVAVGEREGHQTHPALDGRVDVWPDTAGNCVNPKPTPPVVERYGCDGKLITEGAAPPTCETIVVKEVEVPGPERIVTVEGPERVVEVIKEVIGPERIVQLPPKIVTKTKRVVKWRTKVKRVNVCKVPKKPRTVTPHFTG